MRCIYIYLSQCSKTSDAIVWDWDRQQIFAQNIDLLKQQLT